MSYNKNEQPILISSGDVAKSDSYRSVAVKEAVYQAQEAITTLFKKLMQNESAASNQDVVLKIVKNFIAQKSVNNLIKEIDATKIVSNLFQYGYIRDLFTLETMDDLINALKKENPYIDDSRLTKCAESMTILKIVDDLQAQACTNELKSFISGHFVKNILGANCVFELSNILEIDLLGQTPES